MSASYNFRDRVAIVTGGARGIGRSIAEHLRDAGASVVVWDLHPLDLSGISCDQVDVSVASSIRTGLARVTSVSRTIDILVNNASYVGANTSVVASDPSEWRRSLEVNLVSIYEVCSHVVPIMQRSDYGRVVNMASIAGKEGAPFRSAYSAAKAGVIVFTKSLAKELAGTNILVNAIAPAAINTEILLQLSPRDVDSIFQKSPMKRLGTVDEVAALALWLCSEACSFNTGATFDLSGGRAVY